MNSRFNSKFNSKAVSPVVGMVLVLAIIAGVMSIIQTQYIPNWDKQKEVQAFNNLLSEVSRIPSILTSTTSSTSIEITPGVSYSDYPLLVNLQSSYGFVSTIPEKVNISYTVSGPNEVNVSYNYTSYAILVKPNYLYIIEPSLIYEHGAVFEIYNNGKPILLNQVSFSNNSITFPILESNAGVSISVLRATLHFYQVSHGQGTVVNNLLIEFQTKYPEAWKELLSKIYKNSADVSVRKNTVVVKFKEPVLLNVPAWSLKVAVPTTEPTTVSAVSAVVPMSNKVVYVNPNSITKLSVQVLDSYGNPYSGVSVKATVNTTKFGGLLNSNGKVVSSVVESTNSLGIASFYFEGNGSGKVKVSFTALKPKSTGGTNESSVTVVIGNTNTVQRVVIESATLNESKSRCCWYDYQITAKVKIYPQMADKPVRFWLVYYSYMCCGKEYKNELTLPTVYTNSKGVAIVSYGWESKKINTSSVVIYASCGSVTNSTKVKLT